ncbi:hypothetical protein I4U23_019663 [Adineta vaga]|nr:hypothetical protein I4U23_019663 [Adineta vaga]
MSFEDFASTCSRTFAQTPIRLIRMSSPLSTFVGCLDPPYRHLVILCQPHFTDTSISIAFYLNGTAYFEYLNEEKIRQRLQLLNNPRKTSFHRGDLVSVLERLQSMLAIDSLKQDKSDNELHAKLLSSRLLSIEIFHGDLKFKFRCEERSELFEQHYVRQLLIQVKELSQRQTYLCELLEHKDELPQFDSKLFLSTPMTLIDDQEEEDEDDEILSSSTTGRLWKASFGRRGGQNFLDICLLKKSYMKALEDLDEEGEDQDIETVSSILNNIVDQAVTNGDEQNNDDIGLASRIAKRSITSTMNPENDDHQMKRLRSNATATLVSV